MAVLKSFELEGNKLSFANWISNLSPVCTPFTCMINKEKINQTQYSWQTDTLAPASAETFEEGSHAESQTRAATTVLNNFTSIIRRAVNVSETNQAVKAYGRNDEMRYQLGKAGKELMRDLEYTNLSKTKGRAGLGNQASQYSGFKALVAGLNVPDPDTKAVVHLEAPFMEGSRESVLLKELFKVTTNLFIAGSKANKIMFHPKYMFLFNDYISYNEEEPHIHRMYDGLDEKYNSFISKIKDPLGRLYDLIPNRYMPDDEFYIFNENDWTQMVLRAPQRVMIGKTGSSKTIFIETEVGLRHRHPYASGVLSLVVVDKIVELLTDRTTLTAYTGDSGEADLFVHDKDGVALDGFAIEWESSDPTVLEVDPVADTTDANGHAVVNLIPHKPGLVTIRAKGDKMLTEPLSIEVVGPELVNTVDSEGMEIGERIHFSTSVKNSDGTFADDGTVVTLNANSGNIFFLTDPADVSSWVTAKDTVNGMVDTYIAAEAPGTYRIWTSVDGFDSARRTIYVGTAQLDISFIQKKEGLDLGPDADVPFEVVIRNKVGDRIHAGAKVQWSVDSAGIVTLSSGETVTNDQGETSITITPNALGTVNLRVHCYGDAITLPITVRPITIDTVMIPVNVPLTPATPFLAPLQVFAEDADGNPIVNAIVRLATTPTNIGTIKTRSLRTDANGMAQTTLEGKARGDGTITTTVAGISGADLKYSVGQGAAMTFRADPNPAAVGAEITLSGTLTDQTGSFIADQEITFFVENAGHPAIPAVTTSATGTFEQKFTTTLNEDLIVDAICASLTTSRRITIQITT